MAFTRSSVRSRSGPPVLTAVLTAVLSANSNGRIREDEILVLGKKLAFFIGFLADAPLDLVAEG